MRSRPIDSKLSLRIFRDVVTPGSNGLMAVGAPLMLVLAAKGDSPWPGIWTATAATISAFIAFLALLATKSVRDSAIEEKRIAQVSRVFVVQREISRANGEVKFESTVYNQSDLPIWDVDLRPRYIANGQVVIQPSRPTEMAQRVTILPHKTYTWPEAVLESDAENRDESPSVSFVDARSQRWERVGDEFRWLGELEHHDDRFVSVS